MSAAFIQKCNRCGKPFIKLDGCNKMTCSCGNLQCYVCGKSIKDYFHFQRKEGPNDAICPLYETDNLRIEKKIKDAQMETVKKVLEEQSELNEEDVQVADDPVVHHQTAQPRFPYPIHMPEPFAMGEQGMGPGPIIVPPAPIQRQVLVDMERQRQQVYRAPMNQQFNHADRNPIVQFHQPPLHPFDIRPVCPMRTQDHIRNPIDLPHHINVPNHINLPPLPLAEAIPQNFPPPPRAHSFDEEMYYQRNINNNWDYRRWQ
jgi:hypothetical protein